MSESGERDNISGGAAAEAPLDLRARRKSKFIEKLYADCWDDLCRWLNRRYGPGPPEPEDVAQATFAHIIELDSVEHIGNPRAFLFASAVNTMLGHKRWFARTQRLIEGEFTYLSQQVENLTPARIYEASERFRRLIDGVGDLTEQQRDILLRSRLLGQTYEEIAAATGWSLAAISRHLAKALTILEEKLEEPAGIGRKGEPRK